VYEEFTTKPYHGGSVGVEQVVKPGGEDELFQGTSDHLSGRNGAGR